MNVEHYKAKHKLQWYFHYFINNPVYLNEVLPEFFAGTKLVEIFSITKKFIIKYKRQPTKEELLNEVQFSLTREEYTEDYIAALLNKDVIRGMSLDYLESQALNWLKISKFEHALRTAIAAYKIASYNADIDDVIAKLKNDFMTNSSLLSREGPKFYDFFDIGSHKHASIFHYPTGYKFLDDCLGGGYWKGSLITLLSGAKVGKSTWVVNLAVEAAKQKLNVAVVSLELSTQMIMQRLTCKMLNVDMQQYEELTQDELAFHAKLLKTKSKYPKMGDISVLQLPTSRVTVSDIEIELLNKEMELGKKFDIIFIDYFNLIVDKGRTENSYTRVKNIVEGLRGMAIEQNWCVVSPTQTNRAAITANQINLENIAESINVAQTVDALFSIETSDSMKKQGRQIFRCQLSRVSGKQGFYQHYNVNFNTMTIKEVAGAPIDDIYGTEELTAKALNMYNIKAESITQEELLKEHKKLI